MTEPRQKSIGITPKEKERLDRAKELFEHHTGETTDWGGFLGAVAVLGLAALGIYKLVNSSKKNPTATCPVCEQTFSIAYSEDLPRIVYVTCPNPKCGAELVVDFIEPSE